MFETCFLRTCILFSVKISTVLQAGHSPYRGGGRRGGGPFRGGGRGGRGFRPPSSGGSGPPFHGRGRGRGRGRGGRHDQSSSSHPETSAVEEPKPLEGAEPSPQPNPQQPTRIAWCELCRVDCTSKEILEQHKNGKRHKKNLHKLQPTSETQKDENPVNKIASEQEADKQTKVATTDDNNKVETEENDGQEKKPWMNTKRKMRGGGRGGAGGRGAKRQRQTGPLKPKVVIPLMCDLCNVKCDTQEVFDRHVAGKKHISKLKRFEGHQAMYGPTAVQALYPPNPLSQTLGPQPSYYGAPGSYPGSDANVPPPPNQAQNPNPQLADAPLEFGTKNEPQVTATGEAQAGKGV